MNGNAWVSVIILTTFLALVVRRVSGHRVAPGRKLWFGVLWVAIIAALALFFTRFPL